MKDFSRYENETVQFSSLLLVCCLVKTNKIKKSYKIYSKLVLVSLKTQTYDIVFKTEKDLFFKDAETSSFNKF